MTATGALRHVAVCLAMTGPAAAELPRAASTTLCGDIYLLELADRDQIASLSWQATQADSAYAAAAEGLPANRGGLEELIAAGTELLVLDRGVDPQTRRAMEAFGITGVEVELVADFEGIARNLRRVAAALGQPERGEASIARMEARLEAAAPPEGADRPRIVYYRPGGGGAGAGTFVDAALQAAGYRNIQAELGQQGWDGLPLEELVRQDPDGFVISYFDTAAASVRATLGANPILATASQDRPVVTVPGRLWPCAHPVLAEAVEVLAAARHRFTEGAQQ